MTWLNDWLYFTHHIIRNWNQNKSKQRNSERNKWMKSRRRYNYTSFFSKPLFTYWWIKFLDRWTFLKDWESTKGIRSCYWSCQGRGTSCHWEEDEQCWRKQKHTVGGKIIRILLSNNNFFFLRKCWPQSRATVSMWRLSGPTWRSKWNQKLSQSLKVLQRRKKPPSKF